jgi:hypothetical protein
MEEDTYNKIKLFYTAVEINSLLLQGILTGEVTVQLTACLAGLD